MNDLKRLQSLVNKLKCGGQFSQGDQDIFDKLREKYSLNSDGNVTTIGALALIMGKSRRTIHTWKKNAMPIELDGSYDVDRILEWRGEKPAKQKNDQESAPNGDVPGEIDEKTLWDIEFRKFRAKIHEIDFLRKSGELIERASVDELLTERAAEFNRTLMGRARRLALKIAHKDAATCQKMLEDDSYMILEMYSRD